MLSVGIGHVTFFLSFQILVSKCYLKHMDDNISIFRGIQRSLQDFEQPLKIAIFYVLILDSAKAQDFCPGIVCDLFYQYPPSIWVEFCEAGVGHWITLRILWNHPRRPCFKLTLVVIVIPQSHKDKTCLHLFFFCYAFSTCLLPLLWLENKIYHCASFNYVSPCFVMCSITDFW